MTLLNPWVLLGALLAALGCFGAGYWLGRGDAKTQCVANEVRSQSAAITQADTESTRRERVGAARETSREQIRVIYKTLQVQASETLADHPELNACGLDADGLRIWNAANSGVAAPLPSEPNSGVSNTAARAVGDVGRLAGQPYRGDGAGGAVSGSTGEAGGVFNPTPILPFPLKGEGTKTLSEANKP